MTEVAYRGWKIVDHRVLGTTEMAYRVVMPNGVRVKECFTASEAYALIDQLIRHPPTISGSYLNIL